MTNFGLSNITSLFGMGNTGSTSSLYSQLAQYSSIKSGAYAKLTKAYYGKNTDTSKKTESTPAKKTAAGSSKASSAKTEKKSSGSSTAKAAPAPAKQGSGTTSTAAPYWVQVSSYAAKKNADEARAELDKNQIPCEVFTFTKDGKLYYRVRVGPYTTKKEAEYWKQRIDSIDMFKGAGSYVTK